MNKLIKIVAALTALSLYGYAAQVTLSPTSSSGLSGGTVSGTVGVTNASGKILAVGATNTVIGISNWNNQAILVGVTNLNNPDVNVTNITLVGMTNTYNPNVNVTNTPALGFNSYVTNFNLSLTNLADCTNANRALSPEIQISGVNRVNGRAILLQNMCVWSGDNKVPNIGGFLLTKAPCASWSYGAPINLNSADMITNLMTFIPMTFASGTNQVGTNYIVEWSNIGKIIQPLTNSFFLHVISVNNGDGILLTNASWLRMAISQD